MKTIAIITSGSLPIPAVRGGGVETIVQQIIDENEKKGKYKIKVYTCSGAETYQSHYRYTFFININRSLVFDKICRKLNPIIYTLNRRFTKIKWLRILDSYERRVVKLLKRDDSAIVIVENFIPLLHVLPHNLSKIVYHAHYDDVRIGISEFEKKQYLDCYSRCIANISVSDFISKRIKSVLGDDLKLKYYTIHNAIDYDKYQSCITKHTEDDERKRLSIPEGYPVIMYVGRITEEKGITQLIQAFSKIQSKACLVIVGGVFYSDDSINCYLSQLKEMSSTSNNPIIFTGYIPHERLNLVWSIADIAVVPTYSVEEAAGLVVVEAMASGKAVIISDSGAMMEYVKQDCAIIVKRDELFVQTLAEKMEMLCNNETYRNMLGKKAKINAEIHDSKQYFLKFTKIIDELM